MKYRNYSKFLSKFNTFSGIEELSLLSSLYLNHNRITTIESIRNLKALKILALYHNKVYDKYSVVSVLSSLPKLKELSLDGNPCATKVEFNFELIVTLNKLRMLNDDTIKELDRDVAAQYIEMHHVKLHTTKTETKPIIKS